MSHDHHDMMDHSHHNMDHGHHTTAATLNDMGDMGHANHTMEGGGHSHHEMMMQMAFHFGVKETILFNFWSTTTSYGIVGSMIGIAIMAALYEGLKYYREHLFWSSYNALQYRSVQMPVEKGASSSDSRVVQPTMFSKMHAFQTFLHVIQMVISYFLMLIFMTYNVYLCVAVVVGAAIGYFLFGWKKSVVVDVTEHCH